MCPASAVTASWRDTNVHRYIIPITKILCTTYCVHCTEFIMTSLTTFDLFVHVSETISRYRSTQVQVLVRRGLNDDFPVNGSGITRPKIMTTVG